MIRHQVVYPVISSVMPRMREGSLELGENGLCEGHGEADGDGEDEAVFVQDCGGGARKLFGGDDTLAGSI